MSAFKSNRGEKKPYSRPQSTNGQWLHDKAPNGPKKASVNAELGTAHPSNKIVVSNLHYEITPKDLTSIFGQIGTLVREPLIKYDRSGRSSGVAIVSYENLADAIKAKKQFDSLLAKGQPMQIVFDRSTPKRTVSSPDTHSLLNRIQKRPLLERLTQEGSAGTNTKTKTQKAPHSAGPVRNKPKREPRKPKTAEDLDKELDAFMAPDEPAAAEPVTATEDVAMT